MTLWSATSPEPYKHLALPLLAVQRGLGAHAPRPTAAIPNPLDFFCAGRQSPPAIHSPSQWRFEYLYDPLSKMTPLPGSGCVNPSGGHLRANMRRKYRASSTVIEVIP